MKRTGLLRLYLIIALLISQTAAAPAYYQSGNTLKEMCSGSMDLQNGCVGYIVGVFDGIKFIRDFNTNQNWQTLTFCSPERPNVSQLMAIVQRHLETHPETLHLSASYNILTAIQLAFPCN